MRYLILLALLAPLTAADYVQLTLNDGRTLTGLYDATAGTLAIFGGPTVVQVDPKSVTASKAMERPASATTAPSAVTVETKPATAAKPAAEVKPTVKLPPAVQAAKDKADAATAEVIKEGLKFFALAKAEGVSIPGWARMGKTAVRLPSGKDNGPVMAAYKIAERADGALYESLMMNHAVRDNRPYVDRLTQAGREAETAAGYVR